MTVIFKKSMEKIFFQVYMHKSCPPRFSFGIRHSDYMCPLIVDTDDY